MKNAKGFTLIELMIAIAILSILTATAINAFDSQKRKGYRSDAIRGITVMAQRMENWKANTSTLAYTNAIANVGGATLPNGRYTLSLSNVTADTYTVTATAIGTQTADDDCRSFILQHTGRKTATKADASANTRCWPR